MTVYEFFRRNDSNSVCPHYADNLAAFSVLTVGALLPLALWASGDASSPLLVLVAAIASLFAASIPTRLVVTEHGLGVVSIFGRNRLLMAPGQARWWGRHLGWAQLASITLKKNNHLRGQFPRLKLGDFRYSIRVSWRRTYEIHSEAPAFARFQSLARKHVPEKLRDVSDRWWSWLQ